MKVAIVGATGRMGREVIRACNGEQVVAAIGRDELGKDVGVLAGVGSLDVPVSDEFELIAKSDVVIDFSLPSAAEELYQVALEVGVPVVSGTTGLDERQSRLLRALAEEQPVVWAPNFSQGVTLLAHLAALATRAAGPTFDVEIVEMHHRDKRDAPSGTALRLAEKVTEARNLSLEDCVYGRHGDVGPRSDDEVGVMSLRGGSVVGDHKVILAGRSERLELAHIAEERAVFARGAVRAAHWVIGRDVGFYGMRDVMGLAG